MNSTTPLQLLWLLQLSDSGLPIGALSHSYGLETLAAEESLNADQLGLFLNDYLRELSAFEIPFCGTAYRLGIDNSDGLPIQAWLELNTTLSAFKLAHESRIASSMLGSRLLRMVSDLMQSQLLLTAFDAAEQTETAIHHCTAFGLAGAALGIEEQAVLLAYGHQSLAGLISASQRLLPVGQSQATRILWELKPLLAELVKSAQENHCDVDEARCFAPLIELASMRHPSLTTRLFIS